MYKMVSVILFVISLQTSYLAKAACKPQLKLPSTSSGSVDYDPFSKTGSSSKITFSIQNKGQSTCRLRLLLLSDDGSTQLKGPAGQLRFHVMNSGGRWQHTRSGQAVATIRKINIPANESLNSISVSLKIIRGQFAKPGTYSQSFRLSLMDHDGNKTLQTSPSFHLNANVQPHVEARLSFARTIFNPNAAVAIFDLGILKSGLRDHIYLLLRGNTSANISVTSENKGKLKHHIDSTLPAIDYKVKLGPRPASSMNSPLSITQPVPHHLSGQALPISFIIGDTENKAAGIYQDLVRINVTTN